MMILTCGIFVHIRVFRTAARKYALNFGCYYCELAFFNQLLSYVSISCVIFV